MGKHTITEESADMTPEDFDRVAAMMRPLIKRQSLSYLPAGGTGWVDLVGGGRIHFFSSPSYRPIRSFLADVLPETEPLVENGVEWFRRHYEESPDE